MAGATIGYDPHGPDVVMASDFDNATRLFLDAAERCIASERREKELQQRLTAADERIDERDSTTIRDGYAELRCKAFYFESREAVTFNSDGFIGFAGWADEKSVQPVLAGFKEWIKRLTP